MQDIYYKGIFNSKSNVVSDLLLSIPDPSSSSHMIWGMLLNLGVSLWHLRTGVHCLRNSPQPPDVLIYPQMPECWCQSLSPVWLFAIPRTWALQAPLSMGFSRQEQRRGYSLPSSGDLPNPGIEPTSLTLQADSFLSEPSGKPESLHNLTFSVPLWPFQTFLSLLLFPIVSISPPLFLRLSRIKCKYFQFLLKNYLRSTFKPAYIPSLQRLLSEKPLVQLKLPILQQMYHIYLCK